MKHVIYIIIIIILVILNLYQYNKNNRIEINTVEVRDTVVIRDTIKFDNPTLIYVKTEPDTLYIESIDSTVVTIDKETKLYKDSLYELQLSGIRPNLDYINVYPKTTYITTEKVSYVKDKRRFTHGIQAGVGFGIVNKKPDVFIGYGVQINF